MYNDVCRHKKSKKKKKKHSETESSEEDSGSESEPGEAVWMEKKSKTFWLFYICLFYNY